MRKKPSSAGRPRRASEPKRIVTLRIPEGLVKQIDTVAVEDGRSRSSMCLHFIREGTASRAIPALGADPTG